MRARKAWIVDWGGRRLYPRGSFLFALANACGASFVLFIFCFCSSSIQSRSSGWLLREDKLVSRTGDTDLLETLATRAKVIFHRHEMTVRTCIFCIEVKYKKAERKDREYMYI